MNPLDINLSDKVWTLICLLLGENAKNKTLREELAYAKAHLQQDLKTGGDVRPAQARRQLLEWACAAGAFAKLLAETLHSENASVIEAALLIRLRGDTLEPIDEWLADITDFGRRCEDSASRYSDG